VWAEVPVPLAVLVIDPATTGITQLPSWFWVKGGGGPISVTVEMGAYTVTATASPVEYQWDFGDGTSAASSSAGTEAGPSVTHTYVDKGTYTVILGVEYAGSYTFAGPGGTGTASLGVYWQWRAGTPYTVQEVRSVLLPTGGL
jgi:PKD repeat protein